MENLLFQKMFQEEILPNLGGDSTDCLQYRIWVTHFKKSDDQFLDYSLWSQSMWMSYAKFLGHSQTWEICKKDRDVFDEWLMTQIQGGVS